MSKVNNNLFHLGVTIPSANSMEKEVSHPSDELTYPMNLQNSSIAYELSDWYPDPLTSPDEFYQQYEGNQTIPSLSQNAYQEPPTTQHFESGNFQNQSDRREHLRQYQQYQAIPSTTQNTNNPNSYRQFNQNLYSAWNYQHPSNGVMKGTSALSFQPETFNCTDCGASVTRKRSRANTIYRCSTCQNRHNQKARRALREGKNGKPGAKVDHDTGKEHRRLEQIEDNGILEDNTPVATIRNYEHLVRGFREELTFPCTNCGISVTKKWVKNAKRCYQCRSCQSSESYHSKKTIRRQSSRHCINCNSRSAVFIAEGECTPCHKERLELNLSMDYHYPNGYNDPGILQNPQLPVPDPNLEPVRPVPHAELHSGYNSNFVPVYQGVPNHSNQMSFPNEYQHGNYQNQNWANPQFNNPMGFNQHHHNNHQLSNEWGHVGHDYPTPNHHGNNDYFHQSNGAMNFSNHQFPQENGNDPHFENPQVHETSNNDYHNPHNQNNFFPNHQDQYALHNNHNSHKPNYNQHGHQQNFIPGQNAHHNGEQFQPDFNYMNVEINQQNHYNQLQPDNVNMGNNIEYNNAYQNYDTNHFNPHFQMSLGQTHNYGGNQNVNQNLFPNGGEPIIGAPANVSKEANKQPISDLGQFPQQYLPQDPHFDQSQSEQRVIQQLDNISQQPPQNQQSATQVVELAARTPDEIFEVSSDDDMSSSSVSSPEPSSPPKKTTKKERKKIEQRGRIRKCSNCHTTKTSKWRRNRKKQLLCNSCKLYDQKYKQPRPEEFWESVIHRRGVYKTTTVTCTICKDDCYSTLKEPLCETCRCNPARFIDPICSVCNATDVNMYRFNKASGAGLCRKCHWKQIKTMREKLCNGDADSEEEDEQNQEDDERSSQNEMDRSNDRNDNFERDNVSDGSIPLRNLSQDDISILDNTESHQTETHKSSSGSKKTNSKKNGKGREPRKRVLKCSNCGTEETKQWRGATSAERQCNTCYIYERNSNKKRPPRLWLNVKTKSKRTDERNIKKCSNCEEEMESTLENPTCCECLAYKRRTGMDRPPQVYNLHRLGRNQ